MKKLLDLPIALLFIVIAINENVDSINVISSCKVQLDDGKYIDLTSLDDSSNPRSVTGPNGDYVYTFNPCSPIVCVSGLRASAAVCQKAQRTKNQFNCGDQSKSTFDYSENVLTMNFKSGPRESNIKCICGNSESFSLTDESNPYEFRFTSKCCCPDVTDGCKGGGGGDASSGGLSFGSILLIIFFPGLAVYFLIGVLYLKYVKHNTGKDMIPNREFWSSLPSNVKEGFVFARSKVARKETYSSI